MSSFLAVSRNPRTGKKELMACIDNYFGSHEYGFRFFRRPVLEGEDPWNVPMEDKTYRDKKISGIENIGNNNYKKKGSTMTEYKYTTQEVADKTGVPSWRLVALARSGVIYAKRKSGNKRSKFIYPEFALLQIRNIENYCEGKGTRKLDYRHLKRMLKEWGMETRRDLDNSEVETPETERYEVTANQPEVERAEPIEDDSLGAIMEVRLTTKNYEFCKKRAQDLCVRPVDIASIYLNDALSKTN